MSSPIVIDNFLPDADYARLREYVQSQPMKYGSKSNSKTDPHGHWSWKPVHDNRANLADLASRLPNELAPAWAVVRKLTILGMDPVLMKLGALDRKHTTGTLHDHLVRVFQLLEGRRLSHAVCFGGGLHSIYGTNVYQEKLVDGANGGNRAAIATAFGQQAEALAYLFSVLNRPKTLNEPGSGNVLRQQPRLGVDCISVTIPWRQILKATERRKRIVRAKKAK